MSAAGERRAAPREGPGLLARLRPAGATVALLVIAAGSVAVVHRDPWAVARPPVPLVSTQSAARRVFPNLGEQELASARIELNAASGSRVRLVPGPDGRHQLYRDETLLGPADPVAVEGLWSSLRMATTLRAAADASSLGEPGGSIVVVAGDETLTLELAGPAPDGSGHYGVLLHEQREPWVVESEVVALVKQAPETWLSRRLLLAEPAAARRVVFAGAGEGAGEGEDTAADSLTLARGQDDLWRASSAADVGDALLSSAAVEARLDRLFAAPVEQLIAREQVAADSLRPWFTVESQDGAPVSVAIGGACPGEPEQRVVDRGPGLLGCVREAFTEPWTPALAAAELLESQLLPWSYGRVLAVDMRQPAPQRLRRRGGAWVLERGSSSEAPRYQEVAEPEVYRWFADVSAVEVGPGGAPFEPEVDLVFESDTTQSLRIRCGAARPRAAAPERAPEQAPDQSDIHEGGDASGDATAVASARAWVCRRDDGPLLAVRSRRVPTLAFTAETFADRQLVRATAGEVRGIEILPGAKGRTVRQSVRHDMGVWRLDAPRHPDGNDALDEVRLEGLMAAVGGLRAAAWVAAPPAASLLRTVRIERVAARADEAEVVVRLHEDCVVEVAGRPRAARVSEDTCSTLAGDLLYDDPLRAWISAARTIELAEAQAGDGSATATLRARRAPTGANTWELELGETEAFAAALETWTRWRAAGIAAGAPASGPVEHLRVQLTNGRSVAAALGPGGAWLQPNGASWHYVAGELADE